jgi:hypothetical protein
MDKNFQNGGNPINSEGKKAGGNGAKNAANQPEPQRQKVRLSEDCCFHLKNS